MKGALALLCGLALTQAVQDKYAHLVDDATYTRGLIGEAVQDVRYPPVSVVRGHYVAGAAAALTNE
jgi:hypothetical protein